jgi:hypothetical protein
VAAGTGRLDGRRLLALLLGSGALVRLLAEPALLPGFAAGALFIPSLALLLGVAAGTERPLQIILLIWWYLGPLNGLAALDITGVTDAALAQGIPWFYIAASPLLFGANSCTTAPLVCPWANSMASVKPCLILLNSSLIIYHRNFQSECGSILPIHCARPGSISPLPPVP